MSLPLTKYLIDPRINKIKKMLQSLNSGDFKLRDMSAGKEDEVDEIISELNTLAEKLQKSELPNAEIIKHQNNELTQKISELESVNRELESFSYSVSHDLRAPLRSIHGYATILAQEHGASLNEEANTMIASLQSAANRMSQLIDDLLTFSRLGKKEIEKKEVDMEALVTEVVSDVANSYSNIDPKFIIHPLPKAFADNNLMIQALSNLVSNAVKYSSLNEKPLIEIGAEEKTDEIIYFVKDNGIGFDPKYSGKLFAAFQRLNNSGKFEGTGVGLSIVKLIITKHGGSVWAFSKPGEGATFFFSLKKHQPAIAGFAGSNNHRDKRG